MMLRDLLSIDKTFVIMSTIFPRKNKPMKDGSDVVEETVQAFKKTSSNLKILRLGKSLWESSLSEIWKDGVHLTLPAVNFVADQIVTSASYVPVRSKVMEIDEWGEDLEDLEEALSDFFQTASDGKKAVSDDEPGPAPEVFDNFDLRSHVKFAPITQEMQDIIVNAMVITKSSDVVLRRLNIDITKHDLYSLTGTNWLNDQIVEVYLAMIAQRSLMLKYVSGHLRVLSMSTFFFPNLSTHGYSKVKSWTKEVDIFTYDLILVPIHTDNGSLSHWSLASIDLRVPGVFYYDSLGSSNSSILTALLYYLKEEHKDKRGKELDLSKFAKHAMNCPPQQNGSDCGVFCCKVADYLSRNLQLDFSQADVKYFRKRMIWEILRDRLLEP